MVSHLKKIMCTLLPVEAHEVQVVSLHILQSILIGIPRLFTLTAANALFLSKYDPSNLPFIYITTALIIPIAGYIFLECEHRFSLLKVLRGTLLFDLLFVLLFWFLLQVYGATWPAWILLIWYDVEVALCNLVFWGAASHIFTVRQAKRLYGPIGTGEVLASIIGGLIVPYVVAVTGTINLLFISIAGIFLAFVNLDYIGKIFHSSFEHSHSHGDEEEHGEEEEEHHGLISQLISLFKDDYIRLIFVIYALAYFAYYFMDNAFYLVAKQQMTDSAVLAAFIGQFYAAVGIINFVVRTFFYGWWLNRFGLSVGLITTPIILISCCGIVVLGGIVSAPAKIIFFLVVWAKMMERVFAESLNRPASYTLYQPLPPDTRSNAKTTAETMIGPAAGVSASILLLLLKKGLSFSAPNMCGTLIFILFIWWYFARHVCREYQQALKNALSTRGLQGSSLDLKDPSTIKILEKGVESPISTEVIYCLNLLEESELPHLDQLLQGLMDHEDSEVRRTVYRKIEKLGTESFFPILKERLEIESTATNKEAVFRALASTGEMDAFDILAPYLKDPDDEIRQGALVGMIRYCGIEGAVIAGHDLLGLEKSKLVNERVFAAKVLGEIGVSNFYRGLTPLLDDEDFQVREAAINAAGNLGNPRLWTKVVENLKEISLRAVAVKALLLGGESVLAALESAQAVENLDLKIRRVLIHVFGKIKGEKAIEYLKNKLTEEELSIFHEVLLALHACGYKAMGDEKNGLRALIKREVALGAQVLAAQHDFTNRAENTLIPAALEHDLQKLRERIFLLLSFMYPASTIMKIRSNFAAESHEKKAYAIELLEHTVDKYYFLMILPILEELPLDVLLERMQKDFPTDALTPEKRLQEMLTSEEKWPASWMRCCAIDAALSIKIPDVLELIKPHLSNPDAVIRETATDVGFYLKPRHLTWDKNSSQKRIPTIERVKLLKTVSIFSMIPDEYLVDVALVIQEKKLLPDENLFKKGDVGKSMYITIDGKVRVHDEERNLAELGKGSVFGELAALGTESRTASISALEKTYLFELPQEKVYELIGDRLEMATGIIQMVVQKLREELKKKKGSKSKIEEQAKYSDQEIQLEKQEKSKKVASALSVIEKVIILKTADIFSRTPDNILADLGLLAKEIELKKGSPLFSKGDLGTSMYIIVDGKVKIHDGDTILAELGERDILGELAALVSEPRTASVTAIEDTRFLTLNQDSLYELMWDQVEAVRGIITVLIQRLREVIKK
ncbi:Npt1/Npt2 family nucleotide transporter [Candidatus Riflebacteria bacterium]